MTWQVPVVPEMHKPRKSKWNKPIVWCAVLLLLFLLFTPTSIALWGNRNYSIWFWLLLIIAPVAVTFVCWLLLFIWNMNAEAQFKAWETEKIKIHERWQQWAHRHIVVLASDIILPDDQNKEDWIRNTAEIQPGRSSVFERDDENDLALIKQHAYQSLFAGLNNLLPGKNNYSVSIFVDSADEADFYEKSADLELFLQESEWNIQFNFSLQPLYQDMDVLAEWVQQDIEQIYVLFSSAINTDVSAPEFSENMLWVAFSSADWAQKQQLTAKAMVYRPIDFDITDETSVKEGITEFTIYGLNQIVPEGLWLPPLDGADNTRIVGHLGNIAGLKFSMDKEGTSVYQPGLYIGNIPFNINWLIFSCVLDNLSTTQEQLWVAKRDDRTWLGHIAQITS